MPIAYSYQRFSSDAQEGNDSIRRQTAAAQRFIDEHPEHGLVLDTTLKMTDAGVSAYKGANFKIGALGTFMDSVRDGLVEQGSWLLMESLDRFTRTSVNIAAAELLSLINRGIVVVTLHNNIIYREEDFAGEAGLVNILGALIAMQGHHQEQVSKGKRVMEAWKANYSKIANSGHVVTRIVPFWLEVNAERNGFNVLSEKAAVVQEIYERRARGDGKTKIANDVTARGIPTPKQRSATWHPSAVEKILASDSVVGVFSNARGDRFDGYYPTVVKEEAYQACRALRKQPAALGNNSAAHPLTRLIKHDCGQTMRRVNKGARSIVRLRCPHCFNSLPFQHALMLSTQALAAVGWTPSPTNSGADVLQLELNLLGVDGLVEEAYLSWRNIKTKEKRETYERLRADQSELRKELLELSGKSGELLAAIERKAIDRAESPLVALRAIAISMTLDTECTELTMTTISGKVVTVTLDLDQSDAL